MTDDDLAALLAAEAGEALLAVRQHPVAAPTELRDLGDRTAQELLARRLAETRPDDAVLSEEAADDPRRLSASRVWIIDPLDGTREFSEPPRDDWAVHVALWSEGGLVAGAVAIPSRGVVHRSDRPTPVPRRPPGPVRLAVSRSRPPAFVVTLAERLGAELVAMGSAGVKAMSVVDGTADAYVHAGGQYEWDSAAPVAVARAHGLITNRIDGSPLVYNSPDPYLPDLVVVRPELETEVMEALAVLQQD
jgi:3'(2'), 5'-bisphosphate nucleotidase